MEKVSVIPKSFMFGDLLGFLTISQLSVVRGEASE